MDITFLPRSKRLLISWLQSPSAVILEPPKIKSDTISTVSPSNSHEVMGPGQTGMRVQGERAQGRVGSGGDWIPMGYGDDNGEDKLPPPSSSVWG